MRVAVEGDEVRGRLVRIEDHFTVAEADAVAGMEERGLDQRTPLSVVPLTLPQSRTNQVAALEEISAWRRERKRSLIGIVQSEARPSVIVSAGASACCGDIPG